MNSPRRLSIRTGLIVGVLFVVVVTAALVHVPWSINARASVTGLALRLNDQSIDDVRGKMSGLLDQVVSTEATIAANIAAGSLDLERAAARDAFFLSFVEQHPTISAIEVGWLDDRSFAVRHLPGDRFAAEEIEPASSGPARRRTTLYGSEGRIAASQSGSETDYSVSGQFWFKQAFEQSGTSWSDIYPIADNGALGFAAVQAVTTPDGQAGVISVSMELDRISSFLQGVDLGKGGAVFLTNPYAELVASATAIPGSRPLNTPTGTKLADASTPLLRVAAAALSASGVKLAELHDRRQIAHRDQASGQTYFITLSPLTQMGLIVGLVIPESEILGDIDRSTTLLAYILLVFICLTAASVAVLASWTLGRPLAAVTRNAVLLGDFRFDEIKPVASRLTEIAALSQAIVQMNASLASFKKYVPTEIVRMLFAQGAEAELGGTRRELSVFFMDLAHFTKISEALGDDVIAFIGEFLSEMSDEIRTAGGTIDKYIGDAVMAFWGAPVANEAHALASCRAALGCQARLAALRARGTGPMRREMKARIGINSGRVLVGNVGSRDRLNYTAIGDPVNVASRLEALNKRYGTEILIGEDTYRAAKDHIVARRLERVAVYGKDEGIELYELLALTEVAPPDLLAWVAVHERGIDAIRQRSWDEAEAQFLKVIDMRGGHDTPSQLMLRHVRAFRDAPPPNDWDGLLRLSEK